MSTILHPDDSVRRLAPLSPTMSSPSSTPDGNTAIPSGGLEAWKGTLLGVEDELINAFVSIGSSGTEQSPLLIDDDDSDTSSQVSRTQSSKFDLQSHTESTPSNDGAAADTQQASHEYSTFDLPIFLANTACVASTPSSTKTQEPALRYTQSGACVEPVQLLRLDSKIVALLPPPNTHSWAHWRLATGRR